MHVHSISTTSLAIELTAVIALAQHHRKVAHGCAELLRHRVGLRRKREGMLALRIGQTLSHVSHRCVQRDETHRQLRFLGLLLLVFRCPLLGTPLVLLHLVHLVQCLHLAHPSIHHGVDVTLTRGKVTGNVADEIQPLLTTVNIEHHTRSQCANTGTDSRHHWHSQLGSYGLYRVLDALGHSLN